MQAQDESVKEDTPKGQLDYGSMSALWPEMKVPLTNIDGGLFPGDKKWLDGIKEKDMSGTDYMICSYPKCGTTWVMEIMSHLVTGGDISQSYKTPLHDRVTYIDVPDARNKDTESTPTRVSMSHLWPELLPRQILEKSTKIVLVLRNPKAAIVSGFHFFQHLPLIFGPFKGTWDDYFGYAIGEESYYGS